MDAPSRFAQPPILPPIMTDTGDIAQFMAGPSAPAGDKAKPADVSNSRDCLYNFYQTHILIWGLG